MVITSRQEQDIARLMAIEIVDIGCIDFARRLFIGKLGLANRVHQTCYSQRQDGVHMVPQLPLRQDFFRFCVPSARAISKAVEEGIEVVIVNHQDTFGRVQAIVLI